MLNKIFENQGKISKDKGFYRSKCWAFQNKDVINESNKSIYNIYKKYIYISVSQDTRLRLFSIPGLFNPPLTATEKSTSIKYSRHITANIPFSNSTKGHKQLRLCTFQQSMNKVDQQRFCRAIFDQHNQLYDNRIIGSNLIVSHQPNSPLERV